jgi:serine/threonine protein kinase
MLSGTLPFSINNDDIPSISDDDKINNFALQYAIINNEPKLIENISSQAMDLLKGLLNKNPKKRFSCDDVLCHSWLNDNCNNNNNKYHLFTKAEMILLSKTYIDYRFAKIEDIKENFTLSNLERDDKNVLIDNNANCRTKSFILAPYNSINNFFISEEFEEEDDDNDDFSNIEIKLENGIIVFANKVKEFNMNYELNNNGELDNGMLINTKTETISTSVRNNTLLNNKEYFIDDEFINLETKNLNNNIKESFKKDNDTREKSNNILNKIQNLGYDINYVKDCIKNNKICHCTVVYYLMMNYENF